MSFSTANRTTLMYIAEVTAGTTPATPNFQKINYTGEDLNYNVETITSDTIRDDRQIPDLVRTSVDVSGTINAEIQAEAYEDFIEAALQGTWSTAVNFSGTASITATSRTCDATGAFTNAVEGQWVKLGGFTNAGNNGWHQILTRTSADSVIFTTASDSLVDETGDADETIVGKYVRNGTTQRFFTIGKIFNDTTTVTYQYLRGCEVSSMDFNFETGAILTGSFGFMGLTGEMTETAIASSTYTAPSTNEILDSVNSLGTIVEDDAASTSYFQSLTMSLDNNTRGLAAIGTLGYVGISHGRSNITGSTTIYFEDKATFDKYTDGTSFSLSFILSSTDGDMVVTLHNCKFSSMSIVATGIDTDVVAESEFQAILDADHATIQIDVENVA